MCLVTTSRWSVSPRGPKDPTPRSAFEASLSCHCFHPAWAFPSWLWANSVHFHFSVPETTWLSQYWHTRWFSSCAQQVTREVKTHTRISLPVLESTFLHVVPLESLSEGTLTFLYLPVKSRDGDWQWRARLCDLGMALSGLCFGPRLFSPHSISWNPSGHLQTVEES